jgi:hypothetical protein
LLSGAYALYPDEIDHILSQVPLAPKRRNDLAEVVQEEFQWFRHHAEFDVRPSEAVLEARVRRVATNLRKALTAMNLSPTRAFEPIEVEQGLRQLLWEYEIDRPTEAGWFLHEIFQSNPARSGMATRIDQLVLGLEFLRVAAEHSARSLSSRKKRKGGWTATDSFIATLSWHYMNTFGRRPTVTTSSGGRKSGHAVTFISGIVRALRDRAELKFPTGLDPRQQEAIARNLTESPDHSAVRNELTALLRPNRIGNLIEKLTGDARYPEFLQQKRKAVTKSESEKRKHDAKGEAVSGSRSRSKRSI